MECQWALSKKNSSGAVGLSWAKVETPFESKAGQKIQGNLYNCAHMSIFWSHRVITSIYDIQIYMYIQYVYRPDILQTMSVLQNWSPHVTHLISRLRAKLHWWAVHSNHSNSIWAHVDGGGHGARRRAMKTMVRKCGIFLCKRLQE